MLKNAKLFFRTEEIPLPSGLIEPVLSGSGLKPVILCKDEKHCEVYPIAYLCRQSGIVDTFAAMNATIQPGKRIFYTNPFMPVKNLPGYRAFMFLSKAYSLRLKMASVYRLVDFPHISDAISRIDIAEHIRDQRTLYENMLKLSFSQMLAHMWNPEKFIKDGITKFLYKGKLPLTEELRETVLKLHLATLTKALGEESTTHVTFFAPFSTSVDILNVLLDDGWTVPTRT